jgi:hypothetical protein
MFTRQAGRRSWNPHHPLVPLLLLLLLLVIVAVAGGGGCSIAAV